MTAGTETLENTHVRLALDSGTRPFAAWVFPLGRTAFAFLAYVSNEKGNSISVIDTDKMETIATIKTGQRPRGIEVSRDGKLVYVAARRRRHHPGL